MKTETQHTPGPWSLGQNGDKCAKNHAICAGPIVIAKVYGNGYPIGEGWAPDSEANARLIAAAPELLEALKGCVRLMAENNPITAESRAINAARLAIAKATSVDPSTK